MDKQISISAILIIFHLLVSHFKFTKCGNATSICTKTPHPQICYALMRRSTTFSEKTLDENDVVLRDLSLRTTLALAANAHKLISEMDVSSFDELGRSAWTDCLELHQDSIHHLNRSVIAGSKIDAVDAQTWLSAAIANEQTCRNGFLDFNMSSHLELFDRQLMLSEFSMSLTNSLAINKAINYASSSSSELNRDHDHFPDWVSAGDRRLLRSTGRTSVKANIVVARDGSGDYTTISAALGAAKRMRRGSRRFVIYVKKGVYKENVEIEKSMKNLMFVGDGIDATVVTANRNVLDGFTTFRSATFAVSGNGFIARGMTFENTAGPHKHQAVALRSSSDFSVFYDCSFKGYQDTLYVHSLRQFYRNCDVYGTVDFIFGDAVAHLQNCNIYVRKPMIDQKNTVTAQGRKDSNENTGIVIHSSIVTASPELRPVQHLYSSYLGRPWKQYSTTVFLKCVIDDLIDPAGWLPWSGDFGLTTLYYGEYMNVGGGASVRGRVKWPGFHVIRDPAVAGNFTVGNFLGGDSWIPATGVPFTAGL